jgi:hypothetical protein
MGIIAGRRKIIVVGGGNIGKQCHRQGKKQFHRLLDFKPPVVRNAICEKNP